MRPTLLLPLSILACTPEPDTGETGETTIPLEAFDQATADRLDDALEQVLVDHPAPGIQAAVRLPGREPWMGSAGKADLGSELHWDPGVHSKAGSITKTVTAALVLQQLEAGTLSLGDAVSAHLPDFPWGDDITLRHLLQHSSGVPGYAGPLEIAGDQDMSWSLQQLVDSVADQAVSFEAGDRYSYSNTNYVLLGLILERLEGRPWQEITNELLGTIGDGELRVPLQGEGWGEVVPGYLVLPDGSLYEHDAGDDWIDYWHPDAIASAGSLVGNAPYIAAWGEQLWVTSEVLDPETIQTMASDQVAVSSDYAYGLGVVVDSSVSPQRWFHNGAVTGYASWLEARPDDGAVVALVSNCWLVDGSSFSSDWLWDAREALWQALDAGGEG